MAQAQRLVNVSAPLARPWLARLGAPAHSPIQIDRQPGAQRVRGDALSL